MENEQENLDSTNETEETVNEETTPEVETEESSQEESSDELTKLKAENERLKKEKATLAIQKDKLRAKAQEVRDESPTQSLSQIDMLAIMRNNVHEDDVSEVIDYAKLKKISVAEALKSPFMKGLLDNKTEERRTAMAVNTGSSRKSSGKLSDEALIKKASSEDVELSSEEISRLYILRKKQ